MNIYFMPISAWGSFKHIKSKTNIYNFVVKHEKQKNEF